MSDRRAYRCWIPKYGGDPDSDGCGIVRAETAAKARYSYYLQCLDPLPDLCITDIRVRRAPGFDTRTFRSGVMAWYARMEDRRARENEGRRG